MNPRRLNLTLEAFPNERFRSAGADVPALDVQDDAIAGALRAAQG